MDLNSGAENETASKKASEPNNDKLESADARERYGKEKKEKDLEGMHSLLSAAEMLEKSPEMVRPLEEGQADDCGTTGIDMSASSPSTA